MKDEAKTKKQLIEELRELREVVASCRASGGPGGEDPASAAAMRLMVDGLYEREEKLQAIINSTPNVAVEIFDSAGRVLMWNPAAEKIYGWTAVEAVGKTLDKLILTPEGNAEFILALKTIASSGKPLGPDEWPIKRKDGSEGFVISTIFAIPGSDGRKEFVCMDVDITERKLAEQAIRFSEEQHRIFLDNFDGIAYQTVSLTYAPLMLHGKVEEITGYTPGDLLNGLVKWNEIVHPEDLPGLHRESERLAAGEIDAADVTYRIKTRDGGVRWVRDVSRMFNVRWEGAENIIQGSIYDVTNQERMRSALEHERDLLSAITDTSPVGILLVSKEGRIEFANRYLLADLGMELHQIRNPENNVPRWRINRIGGERMPLEELPYFKVATTMKPVYGARQEIELENGRRFAVSVNAAPLADGDGKFAGIVSVIEDITKRMADEQELETYRESLEQLVEDRTRKLLETQEKLLEAERLAVLGQFAGSLAHELRNPLAAIAGFAYLLKNKSAAGDEKAARYLGKIENQVARSTEIIESVLNLSRAGTATHAPLGLFKWLRAECDEARAHTAGELDMDVPSGEVEISADRGQLSIAFRNLVRNAVDAMPGGGRVSVSADMTEEGGERFVRIGVKDTGAGIAPENIGQIFKPLFTTKQKGIGFGLPIVKMIAEKHGGRVEVESAEGRGATFTLVLPAGKGRRV